VKAYLHFSDPEWDGEPLEPEPCEKCGSYPCQCVKPTPQACPVCGKSPCECPKQPCEVCGQRPCVCEKKKKAKVKLADGKDRAIQHMVCTTFWHPDGTPMSAQQFMELLFGKLPEFFKDEAELRALWSVGVWTSEEALAGLNHKRSTRSREEAMDTLSKRSRTWTRPDLPDTLASMFINPLYTDRPEASIDPDRFLISDKSARSVILFGPPGTGKTTLVSGVADAIGWKYIELHPSHFVSEGLPNVQQTADGIFGRLMEVDHAVILFDEIDELVREREMEPDQFGRFLTTSMLPRLAELWKARKVIYFVATNHIEFFDRAITRSERFDAVVFLSPPTFDAKKNEILRILKSDHTINAQFDPSLNQRRIEDALPSASCEGWNALPDDERKAKSDEALPPEHVLGKFALVRWDELNEIALRIAVLLREDRLITVEILEQSLLGMKDGKTRGLGEYCRFISDSGSYERFDASRMGLWFVSQGDGLDPSKLEPLPSPFERRGKRYFAKAPIGDHENIRFPGYEPILCSPKDDGVALAAVTFRKKTPTTGESE
jgi:hypothetical protein